jgi:histone deacetylase complex regulatory component SIN3
MGRNPKVLHHQPNLNQEFVLNLDSQEVFTAPSANMATVLQTLENLPPSSELERARACLHIAATQAWCLRDEHSAL